MSGQDSTPRAACDESPAEGYGTWVHRTCGILGCNDPEHLELKAAGEGSES